MKRFPGLWNASVVAVTTFLHPLWQVDSSPFRAHLIEIRTEGIEVQSKVPHVRETHIELYGNLAERRTLHNCHLVNISHRKPFRVIAESSDARSRIFGKRHESKGLVVTEDRMDKRRVTDYVEASRKNLQCFKWVGCA